MSHPKNGVPPPAALINIINDLFQNEKIKTQHDTRFIILFSRVHLSEDQKQGLVYPSGMTPIGFYVMYQTEKIDAEGNSVLLGSQLVSFVEKTDGFIYGYYFNLIGQKKLSYKTMVESCKPIEITSDVQIIPSDYLEIYHNVLGTTIILGLSSEPNKSPSASLQYAHKSKYYYEAMGTDGIQDPNYPTTHLIGLSKNLCQKN